MNKILLLTLLFISQATWSMLLTRTNPQLSYIKKKVSNKKRFSKKLLQKQYYSFYKDGREEDEDLVEILNNSTHVLRNKLSGNYKQTREEFNLLTRIQTYNSDPRKAYYVVIHLEPYVYLSGHSNNFRSNHTLLPEIKLYPKN